MLDIGEKAPSFTLPDGDGTEISLDNFRGKKVVLWFFPKASTPGWTVEGEGFRDEFEKFNENNITIVGVSADSITKQSKFVEKYNFPYLMLCDESHDMLKAYKAWGLKKFMGREYEGIHRITYLVNNDGIISNVFDKVKTKSDACDILDSLNKWDQWINY